ncbi:MAG TPA: hypothetical protein VIX42_01610, partial [Edaphobacter sp.]
MRQTLLLLIALAILAVAGNAQAHPAVTAAPSLENPDDAIIAIEHCSKAKSWRVTLKAGEPLTLELFTCPQNSLPLFKEEDSDGWPYPYNHQVLLLEKRQREHIEVLNAYYSELEFLRVEPGHIRAENVDAVIWTSNVKCGSCHAGPAGILLWNESEKQYDWNESWLEQKPQASTIEAVLPPGDYFDSDDSGLIWSKNHSAIVMRAAVHDSTPEDAHCCPH